MGNLRIYEIYILSSEVPHFQKKLEGKLVGKKSEAMLQLTSSSESSQQ